MSKRIIKTNAAPAAIGPYSQGVKTGGFVYLSGQIPIDPDTKILLKDDIKAETRQVLENIESILEAAGTNISEIVKITIYLKDMGNLPLVDEVYSTYFSVDRPARTCVQVAGLPMDANIEMDVVAETWL